MRNLKKNTHTLTEGSIWKGILLFALPLLGSSLIQQLYSTVDLIFVGQLLGTKASAAIGASGLDRYLPDWILQWNGSRNQCICSQTLRSKTF
ncbi:MAG: hypothetical protein ACLVIY_11100 [Anaerobutyricum soehngenii]